MGQTQRHPEPTRVCAESTAGAAARHLPEQRGAHQLQAVLPWAGSVPPRRNTVRKAALFADSTHTHLHTQNMHAGHPLPANTVLFQLYDVDGDGLVSVGDVETLLRSAAGESLTEEEVHKLAVSGLDNQDSVDFQGFALVCSSAHRQTAGNRQRHLRTHSLSPPLCGRAAVPVRKRDHEKALVFLPETNVTCAQTCRSHNLFLSVLLLRFFLFLFLAFVFLCFFCVCFFCFVHFSDFPEN